MRKSILARWRSCFLTGLAVTFPALLTLAAVKWFIGTISGVTDLLLFFLPRTLTHESLVNANDGKGPMYWYWSLVALALAVVLISVVGVLARYYIGKKIIDWTDRILMRVPLLNKFYGAIKQVNDAFAGSKSSFKTVVLVEFPGPGNYSVGFITNEQPGDIQQKAGKNLVSVFVPTTPNPTSGFLILVPEDKITKLDMSVTDAIKYIVSLGAFAQESPSAALIAADVPKRG
ncbi:MAG TPA: DUF502 domain-containing protein [Candidatus Acidoferrum sp.]|nr:DUF502 domain-containing protein [Candidatus Acidoferrum sp.]